MEQRPKQKYSFHSRHHKGRRTCVASANSPGDLLVGTRFVVHSTSIQINQGYFKLNLPDRCASTNTCAGNLLSTPAGIRGNGIHTEGMKR